MRVSITVDGTTYEDDVEPRMLLTQYLNDVRGLSGVNVGCDTSNCGCCTVHLNGDAVKACTVLAVQADGGEVTTVHGLSNGADVDDPSTWHPLQRAFSENHGLQCGFCTPGMIMAAAQLLEEEPDPDDEQIRWGLEGNLCRCTGYENIVRSVRAAAQDMRGEVTA